MLVTAQDLDAAVMHCFFDGETVKVLEVGNSVELNIARGCYEPSIIEHEGIYYMTLRNDMCGLVAKSKDGLNYSDLKLWCWDDGCNQRAVKNTAATTQYS